MYRLPSQPHQPRAIGGESLAVHASGWQSDRLTLDLSTSRVVRSIVVPLRWHYEELGSRLRIEASDDGNAWETVWLDWIGGPAMAAALDDPLVVPLRIPLSDVRARYLQIYPAPAWLERETDRGHDR